MAAFAANASRAASSKARANSIPTLQSIDEILALVFVVEMRARRPILRD